MDLIRELKDVRFELNLRGYDCDAVDAFLAKVRSAVAEIESEREADQTRIAALEDQTSSGESDTEGTLRRTLILAQRLADETVADARQSATEMTETAEADATETRTAARAEADEMLSSANHDADQIRREAQSELDAANQEAEQLRLEAAAAAGQTRDVATDEAQRLLEAAETAGNERVAALEATARDEVAAMREPIRDEVRRLEETRAQLRADIAALDAHLVEQRTRVRDAVASLRQGMSGSIEDLERVAADEALMSTVPSPETTDASAADVASAPDIDVVDDVPGAASPAPSVEELAEQAAAEAGAAVAPEPLTDVADDSMAVVEGPDEQWTEPEDGVGAPADAVDEAVGDATELLPIVEPEAASGDVVDLDSEPSALFETDVAETATIVDASSSEVGQSESVEALEGESDGAAETDDVTSDDTPVEELGFVERFTAAIADLPISNRS